MFQLDPSHVRSFVLRTACGAAAVLILSSAPAAGGEIGFSLRFLDVGGAPRNIAAADFNNDGRPDLAVGFRANGAPDELRILLQNAGGGFDTALSNADLPSSNFWDITAGAVNDDGFADLVLTFRGDVVPAIQSGVQVLLGDGAAGFVPAGGGDGFFPTCLAAQYSSLADFDGDGDLDIAAAAQLCFAMSILRNVDGRTFELIGTFGDGYHLHGSAPADLDQDGDIDVAGWTLTSSVKLILNLGGGTFTQNNQGVNTFQVTGFPRALAAVDLDLDGRADLATTGHELGKVTTLWAEGDLSFTRVDYESGPPSTGLAVADLDGDALPDLAVGSDAGQAVNVQRNLGGRQFAAPQATSLPVPINELIAVDLDQDGAIDLAGISEAGGVVALLTNEFTPDASPDINGDGVVGVTDLLILLAAWGPCGDLGGCTADLDGDGAVGVADLLELLANWSAH